MLHHIIFLNMKNRLYMQLQNITTTLSPSCQVLTKIHASIFSVVHHTKWNYGFSVERKIKQNIMTPYPVVGRWLLDHLIGQIPSKGELSPMSKNYTTEPPPPKTLFVITIYEICDKPPSIVRNIILVKMINTSPWKWIEDVNTDVNDWEMIWRSMKAQLCISYNPMAREYLYLKPLRNSRTHSLYTYKQEIEK